MMIDKTRFVSIAALCAVVAGCIGATRDQGGDDITVETSKVVFGTTDPRKDLDAFPNDLATWKWADAVAVLAFAADDPCRTFSSPELCALDTKVAYSETSNVNLCHSEPFADQGTLAAGPDHGERDICTGFLVGDDLMLTAGHCLQKDDGTDVVNSRIINFCRDTHVVYGFTHITGFASNEIITRTDMYRCKEIVSRNRSAGIDYTLFRTDRPVIGHHRLRIHRGGDADVATGTAVEFLSHPQGLPLKVDPQATIKGVTSGCAPLNSSGACVLLGNYASSPGASGGPIINRATGRVEGIHSIGADNDLMTSTDPLSALASEDDGDVLCNAFVHCPANGCTSGTPWSQATSLKGVDQSSIPELPGPGVTLLADFDNDGLLDTFSIQSVGGTFHLQVQFGDTTKSTFDYDTQFAVSSLPPGLDLAWTITVRDFNGDGHDDVLSQFPGFAPIFLNGDGLSAPQISPFGAAISYGGFTVADFNGDAIADVIAQNTVTQTTETFYGTESGLVRSIAIPADCLGPNGSLGPSPHPQALAIVPAFVNVNLYPQAVLDCPGPNGLNQLAYFDVGTEAMDGTASLTAGGNWAALAYRRDRLDLLGLQNLGTEYRVYQIPIGMGSITPTQLFRKPLAANERVRGLTWSEDGQEIHVAIDRDSPLDSRVVRFAENGSSSGSDRVFTDCRTPGSLVSGQVGGLAAGSGIDTVACAEISEVGRKTFPMEVSATSVVNDPVYVGGRVTSIAVLGDIECDPLGGALWGLASSGDHILVKAVDPITSCPVIGANTSFNQLPPLSGGDWTSNGQPLPVAADRSLVVNRSGYTAINGPLFAAAAQRSLGSEVDIDVLVPNAPAAPAWAGTVQLFMNTPTAINQPVGTQDLTPLSRGQWHSLRFSLTPAQASALAAGTRDVSFALATNLPVSPEPLKLRNLRFGGTTTVRATVPTDDPYASAPVFGFEDVTAWSSASGGLSREAVLITQGASALKVTAGGYKEIASRTFRTDALVPTSSLAVDVFVPTAQPNPYWFGDVSAYVSCPSAGVNNAFLATKPLTGLPRGRYSTLTFPVPANVKSALSTRRDDCTAKLALNTPAGAAAHIFDNLRFQ